MLRPIATRKDNTQVTLTFAVAGTPSIPILKIEEDAMADWLTGQPDNVRHWVTATGFKGKLGTHSLVPDTSGRIGMVLAGWGTPDVRGRGRFHLAKLAASLPAGTYHLEGAWTDHEEAALGWLLAGYKFRRYKKKGSTAQRALLHPPAEISPDRISTIANATALTMDLINTPANDMGPDELEVAVRDLAEHFGAELAVTSGDALLSENFPMIHCVGRASDKEPRLLDLRHGPTSAPKVTLVGKGVCFDTGGLNLKPGSSMALMKKDMGGAATTIGLAAMILGLKLPIRLRLLVPAVENSVSAGAFRPGDVLTSRKGLTVEVNNTDAEGRLVLADALALADEEKPDVLVSMATLTGAARVALGPDIPPFYATDDQLAADIATASKRVADPLWRMPYWDPYEGMIEPAIADLDNAPSGGFAGSITAALFLRRFVEQTKSYAHFDIYGWTPSARPARPKGGACQGARALLDMLETRYGNS